MSFDDRLTALTATVPIKCKTCAVLAELSADDRAGFAAGVKAGQFSSVLARALVDTLREDYGSHVTVGETSVRTHIRAGHDPR